MNVDDLIEITRANGEAWAYPHVQRVLALSQQISSGLNYNQTAFTIAAWLHDWGAFPCYRQPGVEHALRSAQVAQAEILPVMNLAGPTVQIILEAIARHDLRDPRPVDSPEALLLREADFLDFLGPLGLARELAWGPNDLPLLLARVRGRITAVRGRFTLPAAQAIAAGRIQRMQALLAEIEQDSLGWL
ncbi:MAG: hypothetical protein IH586_21330 [Anaerolineaceae bacterium]|nr:hypothetical protein [Anaerolineaceae bacterium]